MRKLRRGSVFRGAPGRCLDGRSACDGSVEGRKAPGMPRRPRGAVAGRPSRVEIGREGPAPPPADAEDRPARRRGQAAAASWVHLVDSRGVAFGLSTHHPLNDRSPAEGDRGRCSRRRGTPWPPRRRRARPPRGIRVAIDTRPTSRPPSRPSRRSPRRGPSAVGDPVVDRACRRSRRHRRRTRHPTSRANGGAPAGERGVGEPGEAPRASERVTPAADLHDPTGSRRGRPASARRTRSPAAPAPAGRNASAVVAESRRARETSKSGRAVGHGRIIRRRATRLSARRLSTQQGGHMRARDRHRPGTAAAGRQRDHGRGRRTSATTCP
jgi:hypothetical protein